MQGLLTLTIAKKIYALIAAIFLLVIAVSGSLIWVSRDIGAHYSGLVNRDTVGLVEMMRIRGDLQNYSRQVNEILLVNDPPAGLDALEKSLGELTERINQSVKLADANGSATTKDALAAVAAGLPLVQQAATETLAVKRVGLPDNDDEARSAWGGPTGRPLIVKLYNEIAETADAELHRLHAVSASYSVRTEQTATVAMALIAAGLLASALVAFAVTTRGIARPLAALGRTMQRLANHDLAVEVGGTRRRDEIGAMARAVQVFKDDACRTAALERDQAEARTRRAAEDERVREEATQAAAAEAAALVVGSIGKGLEHLAAGDLTYRLDTVLPPAYEQLRADLNSAMGQMHELIGSIVGNTAGIQSGTDEIANAADDLHKRTEKQAASLEETAAALDEITATVRKTAAGASQAREIVSRTKADAEHSGEILQSTVTAMGEIEKSAQQIGQIIGIINEISFQTNLLALNAGVEAARAGDAGRGFAVVASEVRALAQRSSEASKEIKNLISASARHIGSGVTLVNETGEAVTRIARQVAEIDDVVCEIAASTQEQATGLAEVNTSVNQMDQVTQQNAAMVEQSTAASHTLAEEAGALVRLTNRFQLESAAA